MVMLSMQLHARRQGKTNHHGSRGCMTHSSTATVGQHTSHTPHWRLSWYHQHPSDTIRTPASVRNYRCSCSQRWPAQAVTYFGWKWCTQLHSRGSRARCAINGLRPTTEVVIVMNNSIKTSFFFFFLKPYRVSSISFKIFPKVLFVCRCLVGGFVGFVVVCFLFVCLIDFWWRRSCYRSCRYVLCVMFRLMLPPFERQTDVWFQPWCNPFCGWLGPKYQLTKLNVPPLPFFFCMSRSFVAFLFPCRFSCTYFCVLASQRGRAVFSTGPNTFMECPGHHHVSHVYCARAKTGRYIVISNGTAKRSMVSQSFDAAVFCLSVCLSVCVSVFVSLSLTHVRTHARTHARKQPHTLYSFILLWTNCWLFFLGGGGGEGEEAALRFVVCLFLFSLH